VSKACTCELEPDYFCQAANENMIIARVQNIVSGGNYGIIKVIETISNHSVPDTIHIMGDDGINCGEYLPFAQGGDFLVALRFWTVNGETEYELYGCGIHYVPIQENDTLSLNFDPCIESIAYNDFVDDFQSCINKGVVVVNGQVHPWKEGEAPFNDFTFSMNGEEVTTDENGFYDCISFHRDDLYLFEFGETYTLVPNPTFQSAVDYHISIKDLIITQRHILGIETFQHPEQYLAADLNNDAFISLLDLIILRKVILGQLDEFPNQENWIFVDSNLEFDYPSSPWQSRYVYPFTSPLGGQNANYQPYLEFTAIKVGDVSGDL
jgi:hypothetical protein